MTRLGIPWLWGADVEKGWTFDAGKPRGDAVPRSSVD